jgi:hypothetical protein
MLARRRKSRVNCKRLVNSDSWLADNATYFLRVAVPVLVLLLDSGLILRENHVAVDLLRTEVLLLIRATIFLVVTDRPSSHYKYDRDRGRAVAVASVSMVLVDPTNCRYQAIRHRLVSIFVYLYFLKLYTSTE